MASTEGTDETNMASAEGTDEVLAPAGEQLDPRRFKALAVIVTAQLMILLDSAVATIALPPASRDLHISVANSQWMLTGYTLAFGALLLLGGRIADYLGRKRILILSLVGFGLASALGGLAQDQAMLFAARGLQGAMAAMMAPAASHFSLSPSPILVSGTGLSACT